MSQDAGESRVVAPHGLVGLQSGTCARTDAVLDQMTYTYSLCLLRMVG
jgi:hypothetical protein